MRSLVALLLLFPSLAHAQPVVCPLDLNGATIAVLQGEDSGPAEYFTNDPDLPTCRLAGCEDLTLRRQGAKFHIFRVNYGPDCGPGKTTNQCPNGQKIGVYKDIAVKAAIMAAERCQIPAWVKLQGAEREQQKAAEREEAQQDLGQAP